VTLVAINHGFEIPLHADSFPIQAARSDFPPGAKLPAIPSHMQVRGRAFHVDAVHANVADGKRIVSSTRPLRQGDWWYRVCTSPR